MGLWVASDDPTVVKEVRALGPTYFPNVTSDAVVWVGGGVPGGPETQGVATQTALQVTPTHHDGECHKYTVGVEVRYHVMRSNIIDHSGGEYFKRNTRYDA